MYHTNRLFHKYEGPLSNLKLFNEPVEVDQYARLSTVEQPAFLLTLGHVVTAPSTEDKQVVGSGPTTMCYHVDALLLMTRLLNKSTRQQNTVISLVCLLIIASKHQPVISCGYGR